MLVICLHLFSNPIWTHFIEIYFISEFFFRNSFIWKFQIFHNWNYLFQLGFFSKEKEKIFPESHFELNSMSLRILFYFIWCIFCRVCYPCQRIFFIYCTYCYSFFWFWNLEWWSFLHGFIKQQLFFSHFYKNKVKNAFSSFQLFLFFIKKI